MREYFVVLPTHSKPSDLWDVILRHLILRQGRFQSEVFDQPSSETISKLDMHNHCTENSHFWMSPASLAASAFASSLLGTFKNGSASANHSRSSSLAISAFSATVGASVKQLVIP
jgi:hypothetical protein